MSRRQAVSSLMRSVNASTACPCHTPSLGSPPFLAAAAGSAAAGQNPRSYATPVEQADYAFELAASNLRFGEGVTREVGMDFNNLNAKKVAVFTDSTIAKLQPMQTAINALDGENVNYVVFDRCRVEPNSESWAEAVEWARKENCDAFLAVGGGSVMDTAKVANLFSVFKDAEILDFVNAPVGKGQPINTKLFPLLAVPTTAGTGSETTGTAIFDYTPLQAKTGIANRALKPLLGLVDPLNTRSCSKEVHISSGLDVLFHSLESYTAIPYNERTPRPANPLLRPAYQGRNPMSDVFSRWALKETVKHLPRVAKDASDFESTQQMLLASSFAGVGFGNAGVHLCHGISYPISGLNKSHGHYKHPGYQVDWPIVPHGISVAVTGPAVFKYTSPSAPDRHREAAAVFNTYKPDDVQDDRVSDEDMGDLLADRIARFIADLGVPRGLKALGYQRAHIPELVEGTLPQRRVLDLAPGMKGNDGRRELEDIISQAYEF